jgi:hypothetical protein
MDEHSLADFVVFINQQIDVHRQIEVRLWGLEALLTVCLAVNFYDISKSILQHYFSVVSDLIEDLITIHQTNFSNLMKQPH